VKLVKRIVFKPSLGKCVETLAREKYWGLVDEYARRIQSEGINREMEAEIEALRSFLEDMDVAEYRKRTEEYLERGEEVLLVLEITEDGSVDVRVDHPRTTPSK
jgi:hypothetical protein